MTDGRSVQLVAEFKQDGKHPEMQIVEPNETVELPPTRSIEGDSSALHELIRPYHRPLLRRAVTLLPSRHSAEELVQETWAAAVEALPNFEARSTPKTWIFRILINKARTTLRRRARWVLLSELTNSDIDQASLDLPQNTLTPERLLIHREALGDLRRALERMPPSPRAVLNLRVFEGLENEEVARLLRINRTYQRVLLHRARSRLRRELRNQRSTSRAG